MGRFREIERKFDTTVGTPLPDLTDVGGIATVTDPAETTLEATYFDTRDVRLAAHRTTLRRRTGGADQGWHLKLPAGDEERTEIRRGLDSGARKVPKALAKKVRGLARRRELGPVAILRTTRLEQRLVDPSGKDLAIVADDTVHATRLGGGSVDVSAWREVEVELVGGDQALLDAVSAHLEAAGLTRSASSSKLQRTLGLGNVVPGVVRGQHKRPDLTPRSRAGAVALAHLREQVEELIAREPGAREDEPDAVHKMRVATRRLRSALSTYRPLLRRNRTDPVRDELKWLADALGEPRDAEVLRDRLRHLAKEQPGDLVLGPVLRRIDQEMGARHRTGRDHLLEALGDERYRRLLGTLNGLVADPPFTKAAHRRAKRGLPRLVARAAARVDRAARAADGAATPEQREALLHEVRKAAKRTRYAAESVAPVFGKPAKRLAKRMERLQDVLGEHQDSIVNRDALRRLGVAAHLSGENGFTFGLLHEHERRLGDAAQREYEPALRAASKKSVRRWTK
ncbi:MAG: CHAD domain-containing protein [Pseudonocardiaceae bacterium]